MLADVSLNEAFIVAIQQHPVLQKPADHIDAAARATVTTT